MSSDQEQDSQEQTPKSKIQSRGQQAAEMPGRRPTPTSLLVYVAFVILTMVYGLVIPGEPVLAIDQRLAITLFVRLLLIFLLVNRSWIGWILAVVFETLQIILVALLIEPPGGPKIWGMLFLHTATLALLLTGATRQHIWRKDPEPAPVEPDGDDAAETTPDEETDRRQADSSSSGSSS
ncbi:MAG: hypothetical protein ACOC9Y_06595 [Chloroflexota bacterium]